MRNLLLRTWWSFGFSIAVFLGIAGMAEDSWYAFFNGEYLAQHDLLYWAASAFTYGITKLFLPLISALPILCFCTVDRESGYQTLVLHHVGWLRFTMQRIGAAFLSGAVSAAFGLLLYLFYIALRAPLLTNLEQSIRQTAGPVFRQWVLLPCGWPYLLTEAVCLGVTAGTWSLITLAFSNFFHHSGQLTGVVFFVHYLLSWSLSGTSLIGWSPMRLQSPSVWCTEPLIAIALRLVAWLALAILLAFASEWFGLRRMYLKGAA